MRWAFQFGERDGDALLAQRAITMWLMGKKSTAWSPEKPYAKAYREVFATPDVLDFQAAGATELRGTIHILVGRSQRTTSETLVQSCLDERGVAGAQRAREPGPSVLVTITKTPPGSRVSEVNQDYGLFEVPGGRDFYAMCKKFDPTEETAR